MEPCSRQTAIGPYPEPNVSIPHLCTLLS